MYTFEFHNNHIILLAGDIRCLLDTGSPISIGNTSFALGSRSHSLTNDGYLGITVAELGEFVGTKVDVLLGADILAAQTSFFVWNFKSHLILRGACQNPTSPLRFVMGVPVLDVAINGSIVACCVDTGAAQSYLAQELIPKTSSVATGSDFYPGIGRFETHLYQAEYIEPSIPEKSISFMFASLPGSLEGLLKQFNIQAILGVDWLTHQKSHFAIDYQKGLFSNF